MSIIPRQRVLDALNHQKTDRVPLDFWATNEVIEKLKTHFNTEDLEVILQKFHIDIRQFQPDYIGPDFIKQEDGSYFDMMGVHRRPMKNEFCEYEEYASWPLGYVKEVSDFESYKNWPDINNLDFENLSEKIGDTHKTYYIKIETGGLFELAWALRGYERFMMDMIDSPDIAHYIMQKLTDFYCEFVHRAMKNAGDKIDMVYTYDDIASQRSLLISPTMWETFIKPYHVQLNKVIKSYNKTIMYHSCGSVFQMIPKLIDLPIDVLNPLQPMSKDMDFEKIKELYGDKAAFHGGMDIQFLLPKGTVKEVEETVKKTIDILAKDGGYILTSAHYMQADTPIENIVAMYETANKYLL